MQSKFITYQQQQVHYTICGTGNTIVLLHGFGEDGTVWHQQVEFLSQQFRIIVPDLPGSGRSDLIGNADINTYAAVVAAILQTELQEQPVTSIIGHSMGGYVTLALVEKYPSLTKSYGLFHSSAFADNDEKKQVRQKAIQFIQEKGAFAFLKTSIPGLFGKPFSAEHPGQIETLIEKAQQFTSEALRQYYEAMIARPDRTGVLRSFAGPVLFIIGEQDNAVPLQSSLAQCYLPAQSHVHILTGVGHMGMWEEAEKSNGLLQAFLKDI